MKKRGCLQLSTGCFGVLLGVVCTLAAESYLIYYAAIKVSDAVEVRQEDIPLERKYEYICENTSVENKAEQKEICEQLKKEIEKAGQDLPSN